MATQKESAIPESPEQQLTGRLTQVKEWLKLASLVVVIIGGIGAVVTLANAPLHTDIRAMNGRLDRMDRRMDRMEQVMQDGFKAVDDEFKAVRGEMQSGFKAVDDGFKAVHEDIADIHERLTRIETLLAPTTNPQQQ